MMKRGKYALILKKYKYAAVVILIGILLLCWPAGETKEKEKTPAIEESLAETEERMEKILSEIEGAGELQLMLTVEAGSEQLLAREQSLSYSGAAASPEEYDRSETCVVLSKGSGGEEQPHDRGQRWWPGGPTPRPRSCGCAGAGGPRGAIPD